ncbi:MAG: hypothetical protein HWN79_16510 [Candidatus Lokiarchaeota archaeon]|nr:hypothetical protein [Candidatus Lokiarchaeota archaeon]
MNERDPTKEAFFSDMGNIEEEIASEAYELVRHALSLVEAQFYDDSIEILRQAIGLYSQINKSSEIEALNGKIDEIYLLKEKTFRERELKTGIEIEMAQEEDLLAQNEEESYKEADSLIVKAIELVNNKQFNEALDMYDDVIKILTKLRKSSELEKINDLIEDCYNRKADFLRKQKIPTTEETTTTQQEPEGEMSELELKAQKIRAYEEAKRNESEKSNQAYEKIGKATELKNIRQYDESLKLFKESVSLFGEINWINEVKKIENMIEQVEREKERFLLEKQQIKDREQLELDKKKKHEAQLIELANIEEQIKIQEKAEKVKIQVEKKQEEIKFQNEISEMVNYAEMVAREYDISMKKAVKKGEIVEECAYSTVIKIYEQVKQKVNEKGWKDRVAIYDNQIRYYHDLLEKDNKLRDIESQKIQKQKEFDESLKIKEEILVNVVKNDQLAQLKEQRNGEAEIKEFKNVIEKSVKEAEKMAREYDSTFKKAAKLGNLNFDSKYPEIIKIFVEAREKVLAKGWNEDAVIYSSHVKKYTELFDKEKKVRELESKKDEEKRVYEEFQKPQRDGVDVEKLKLIEAKKLKEFDEKKFQDEISNLVNEAEKMARDYDVSLKKALKEDKLIEDSPFGKIIEIYNRIKDTLILKGWKDQALIYTNQIKIYQEKWGKDKKLRELEHQKMQKQREYEDSLKIKTEEGISGGKTQEFESKQQKEIVEKHFQDEIAELVNKAEKMARDYEMTLKKALKEGKLIGESPYLEVIEIYTNLRRKILEKGWTEQGLIYTNQIKIYQEKLENDKKLREIERNKILKQEEFENAQKMLNPERPVGVDIDKLKKLEELTKIESEEEKFEREIDEVIENAEKKAREYESALKRKEFEKECPYLEIVETYKKIRESVYARGWKDEAEIYGNQILLYQEKFENDKHLREIEAEKIEKQVEFKEALKTTKKEKTLRLQELDELSSQDRETEELTKKAMDLIGEAEKVVRSYELSLKKDILTYKSPYDQVILNYENARKLFQKIGWKEEAHKLGGTINFYKDKKMNDDKLRALEQQKLEVSKQKVPIAAKKEVFAHEQRIIDFEKIKEAKSKESEEVLSSINHAERLAKEYELKKKEGILTIDSPFEEIISIYKKAKLDFNHIGWIEEAIQLDNSLNYYKEKLIADKRLRALEKQKTIKQEAKIKKQKIEKKLAKEAEEELLKLKAQALEVKKRSAMEYESKKDQAFNFMDLAKKELKQYNFEKAVSYYKESEKIFAEINWPEGVRMIKESINVIKIKKERIERETKLSEAKKIEKLKLEAQIQDKISKAKDLQNMQQEQRRKELLTIQEEKEREREISEKAYGFLGEGTRLKDKKRFEEAYEKYILGRDMFKKIGWEHEVSRINNDLLIILKKEMKQTEKLKAYQQKKVEEKKELEELLKDADEKQKELDQQKKVEKRKQREKLIQKERDIASDIIKTLKYNEGVLALRRIIKKIENTDQDKMIKELNKQIEVLENASQVPIITKVDLDKDENLDKFKLAFQALDKAQISLSTNSFLRAITELNEALYNLRETQIGIRFISVIEDRVNTYKKELDIKKAPEQKKEAPKIETDDIRKKIAARRAERRRRIKELMDH